MASTLPVNSSISEARYMGRYRRSPVKPTDGMSLTMYSGPLL